MADSAGSTQKTEAGPQERPRRARRIIGPLPDSLCLVCLYSVQLPVALHRLIIISSGFPRLEPAQLQSSPVGVRDKRTQQRVEAEGPLVSREPTGRLLRNPAPIDWGQVHQLDPGRVGKLRHALPAVAEADLVAQEATHEIHGPNLPTVGRDDYKVNSWLPSQRIPVRAP